ncbi:MAG: M20/M25/M40 family metallo-hydrolase [Nannocystaceae bacterium]
MARHLVVSCGFLLACQGAGVDVGATLETSGEATTTSAGATSAGPSTSSATTAVDASTSAASSGESGAPDLGGAALPCGPEGPDAVMACVDRDRYAADVEFIAAVRTPGSTHWHEVQERCVSAFDELGLDVELHTYATGVNVLATLPGSGPGADERVILGAHYDHIEGCDGADDNATGVAGVLEVARALAATQPARTVQFACWDEEELGLRGSRAHASALQSAGVAVRVAFNFDMIGFTNPAPGAQIFPGPLADRFPGLAEELVAHEGRADFIAVVTDDLAAPFALDLEARAESLGRLTGVMALSADEILSGDYSILSFSDHRSFWERGAPALQVFDTGVFRNPAYHCQGGEDVVATLDHDFAFDVLRATAGAIAAAAGVGDR